MSPRRSEAEPHPAGTKFPYHIGQATVHWRQEVPATEKRRRRPAQYRLLWTDATGERREATSGSWPKILGRAKEISADLEHPGSAGDPASALTGTFDSYFAVHSSRGWARDASLYRTHIRPHIEGKAVRDFRPMLVLSILQQVVDAGYARATCLAVRGVMSKVAGWAQTFELLPPGYNPVTAVKVPGVSKSAAAAIAAKRATHIPMGAGLLGADENDPMDDGDRGNFTAKLPDGAVPSFDEARAGRTAFVEVAGVEHFGLLWDTWELLGLRWGESIYLRPECLEPGTWNLHIDWQFSELDSGEIVRTRPKNNKTRVVVVPPPMRDPWMARAEAVARERTERFRSGAEKNLYGLMFAGPQGGVLRRSNMNRRILTPARLKAEWPGEKWQEEECGVWRYAFRWGIHSLRHRFCSVAVKPKEEGGWGWDIVRTAYLAGHANSEFTRRRYVGPTSDVVETTALIVEQHDWTAY